ncbi:MAG: RraA family protein [Moorea sp. SIO3I7]|uniref:RraA family protein n=1 Tax=Moorena sp. SIO3I8 TaxID=2607833 RepID=UPI0013C18326|nr:hypothetical protein [Moorena sp. SIO3I8]NEN96735.1 RraA family protein [Moorena sp. SIO3I7]NEO07165.1 RraA family protein [Moorena sp. SIO3I8]
MATKPQSSEIHSGIGFRIKKNITRCDRKLLQKLSQFETPDISDMMNRLYTINQNIKNLINDQKIIGTACTVKVFPGDNLMVHKALDIAQPGDIIVVDGAGSTTNGIIGDLIATKAKHRGIAGFVIDGMIRDLPGIKEVGMPVYATGVTPIGPLHRGPGEINFSINCGGIVVNPGDIICGDLNGLVVIRQELAEELLEKLLSKKVSLKNYIENVKKGEFSNDWVDQILSKNKCWISD